MYPDLFIKLIECLENLPGVGAKTAQRYAFKMLEMDNVFLEEFAEVIKNIKKDRFHTEICLFWQGCTNSMLFEFSTYMFEPLHI